MPSPLHLLPAHLPSDFIVPASRECIDNDSAWNQMLRQHIPELLLKARKGANCLRPEPTQQGGLVTGLASFPTWKVTDCMKQHACCTDGGWSMSTSPAPIHRLPACCMHRTLNCTTWSPSPTCPFTPSNPLRTCPPCFLLPPLPSLTPSPSAAMSFVTILFVLVEAKWRNRGGGIHVHVVLPLSTLSFGCRVTRGHCWMDVYPPPSLMQT